MISDTKQRRRLNTMALKASPWTAGFTLIETLIAVVILTTAIAGPLTIVGKGLTASLIAKDQTLAFNLAQDAVEFVRFMRDTNRLGGGNWLSGLDGANGCVSADGSALCRIDSIQNTVVSCGLACAPLNFDSTNLYYTYAPAGGSVSPTIFTRSLSIATPVGGNSNEARLTVVVSWSDQGTIVRKVTVLENLFNWQ